MSLIPHQALPNNYTSDWSNGLGDKWAETVGLVPPNPVFIDGKWKLRYDNTNCPLTFRLMPRFIIGGNQDFVVTATAIVNAVNIAHLAVTLYQGESRYTGLYLRSSDHTVFSYDFHNFESGGDGLQYHGSAFVWALGDKIKWTIEYNATTQTVNLSLARNGGANVLLRTNLASTDDYKWSRPFSLWIQGTGLNSATWNIDWEEITVVRSGTKEIIAGAFDYMPWGAQYNFQNAAGMLPHSFNTWQSTYDATQDWRYLDPPNNYLSVDDSQEHMSPDPAGIVPNYSIVATEWDESIEEYLNSEWRFPAGSGTVLSPVINGNFDTLYLYGHKNGYSNIATPPTADAKTRVRIVNEAGVPITGIPATSEGDNTSGFYPNGKRLTAIPIDLTGITETAIRLEIYQYNNSNNWLGYEFSEGGFKNFPTALNGFMIEGVATTTTTTTTAAPSPYGPELITNGLFESWSNDNPVGWSVGGESGSNPVVTEVVDGCRIYTSGNWVYIGQSVLTVGATYRIEITSTITAGGFKVQYFAADANKEITTGAFVYEDVAASTTFQIGRRIVGATNDGVFHSVSVKQVLNPTTTTAAPTTTTTTTTTTAAPTTTTTTTTTTAPALRALHAAAGLEQLVTIIPATTEEALRLRLADSRVIGLPLVAITDPHASAMRVMVNGQLWALRRD